MIEGFDKQTITRCRKLVEGGLFPTDEFKVKHNKHIPVWMLFTYWACMALWVCAIALITWRCYG
jgi:hypothetical protein